MLTVEEKQRALLAVTRARDILLDEGLLQAEQYAPEVRVESPAYLQLTLVNEALDILTMLLERGA